MLEIALEVGVTLAVKLLGCYLFCKTTQGIKTGLTNIANSVLLRLYAQTSFCANSCKNFVPLVL